MYSDIQLGWVPVPLDPSILTVIQPRWRPTMRLVRWDDQEPEPHPLPLDPTLYKSFTEINITEENYFRSTGTFYKQSSFKKRT